MKTVSWLNVMLLLLPVSECGSSKVLGRTGENVTLTCKYDIRYHGARPVCWVRGEIPSSGCNNQLISTDGQRVIEGTRASSRYRLLGRLDGGDVSLTIMNVSEEDSGRYGCRVDIVGWFNDDKHHFDVTVERGSDVTQRRGSDVTATKPMESTVTPDQEMWSTAGQQQRERLQIFIKNTIRVSSIILITAAMLLCAAYRVWRNNQRAETDRKLDQSEEEEDSAV